MALSPRTLLSGAAQAAGSLVSTVTRPLRGGSDSTPDVDRSAAAQKAARTRATAAKKRSEAGQKAAATRKANASARSSAAKRGAKTRAQKKARVDAMVEATKRD